MIARRSMLLGAVGTFIGASTGWAQQERPVTDPVLVQIQGDAPSGEIHILPDSGFLYWILGDGIALRYLTGVGYPGIYQAGIFTVGEKKEWPSWQPTPFEIQKKPNLRRFVEGIQGGPSNPLGARALYLHGPSGDTRVRIHGTPDLSRIEYEVPIEGARLLNAHMADLYNRVTVGAKVVFHALG